MESLIGFMNGMWGRVLRVLLGVGLIYLGLVSLGGSTSGIIIAVVGLLPIVMGLWGRCLLEFVFGRPSPA